MGETLDQSRGQIWRHPSGYISGEWPSPAFRSSPRLLRLLRSSLHLHHPAFPGPHTIGFAAGRTIGPWAWKECMSQWTSGRSARC